MGITVTPSQIQGNVDITDNLYTDGNTKFACTNETSGSGTTGGFYRPAFTAYRTLNSTYYPLFNISGSRNGATCVDFHVTGGGGNSVLNMRGRVMASHYLDVLVESYNLSYSQASIKVTTNNNENITVWLAVNTYQDRMYGYYTTVLPLVPCQVTMNPTSTESSRYFVHTATNTGHAVTATGTAPAGSGPTSKSF
jgi:hypothetical protein